MEWVNVHCDRCGVTYTTDRRLDPLHHACRCEFCGGVAREVVPDDPSRPSRRAPGSRFGGLGWRRHQPRGAR